MAVVLSTLWSVAALEQKNRQQWMSLWHNKLLRPSPGSWLEYRRMCSDTCQDCFQGGECHKHKKILLKGWMLAEVWSSRLPLTFRQQRCGLQGLANYCQTSSMGSLSVVKLPYWLIKGPAGARRRRVRVQRHTWAPEHGTKSSCYLVSRMNSAWVYFTSSGCKRGYPTSIPWKSTGVRTCAQHDGAVKSAQLQLLICQSCGLHTAPLSRHRDFHSARTLQLLCVEACVCAKINLEAKGLKYMNVYYSTCFKLKENE